MTKLVLKTLSNCPLCKRKKANIYYQDGEIFVFRCECGLKYLNPCLSDESMYRLYESSETLELVNPSLENYYEYAALEKDTRTKGDYEKVLSYLEDTQTGRKLLDIGFGSGMFLALAEKRGWQVDGIDSSKRNVEQAEKRFGLILRQGVFPTKELSGQKYDVVSLWDVIEHTDDPHGIIQEVSKILNPHGIIVLATPNADSLLNLMAYSINQLSANAIRSPMRKLFVREHTLYLNKKCLKFLCEANGFGLLSCAQTETDLDRYAFNLIEKAILKIIFVVANIFNSRNRLIFMAKKIDR